MCANTSALVCARCITCRWRGDVSLRHSAVPDQSAGHETAARSQANPPFAFLRTATRHSCLAWRPVSCPGPSFGNLVCGGAFGCNGTENDSANDRSRPFQPSPDPPLPSPAVQNVPQVRLRMFRVQREGSGFEAGLSCLANSALWPTYGVVDVEMCARVLSRRYGRATSQLVRNGARSHRYECVAFCAIEAQNWTVKACAMDS